MTNTEIVKSIYAAFGRGDIAAVVNAMADDVEWLTPGSGLIPYAGRFRGRGEVGAFFQQLGATTDLDPFTPEQYVEQGDTVVALGSYTGRAKGGQKPFQSGYAMVFTVRGGKVVRFQEHQDTEAIAGAFAAAPMAARRA